MIDMVEDGRYIIVGEKRHHRSLQDLVNFHRRTPIFPYSEVLTVTCGKVPNCRKLTSVTESSSRSTFFFSYFKRMTRPITQNCCFLKDIRGTTQVCNPTALCFPVRVVQSPLMKSHLPSRIDPTSPGTLTSRSQPARTYMPPA